MTAAAITVFAHATLVTDRQRKIDSLLTQVNEDEK
jgi:hypothetical protein